MNSIKLLYINNGDHDDPHESPKKELEGTEEVQNRMFSHITGTSLNSEWFDKLHYIVCDPMAGPDFHVRGEDKENIIQAQLLLEPPKTPIRDLKVKQGKFPKVLVKQSLKDTPVELPTAMQAIETDWEYYDTQESQAQVEQTVDYWFKKANYLNAASLVFALVANSVPLTLIIAFIVGCRFRKKLVTLVVTLSQTKPLKALEIEGLYTTKAPTLPI